MHLLPRAPVLGLHPKLPRTRPSADGVAEPAAKEDERRFAGGLDLGETPLHHGGGRHGFPRLVGSWQPPPARPAAITPRWRIHRGEHRARVRQAACEARIACFRRTPVTATNSSRILRFSPRLGSRPRTAHAPREPTPPVLRFSAALTAAPRRPPPAAPHPPSTRTSASAEAAMLPHTKRASSPTIT